MRKIFYLFIFIVGYCSAPIYAQNRALDFDGVNDRVVIPNINWSGKGCPVTVEFWNKVDAGKFSTSFMLGSNGTHRLSSHTPWIDNILYWDYGNIVGNGRITVDYTPYLGKWTHVALVSEGNGGSFRGIYLDGVLVASINSSDGPDVDLNGLILGSDGIGAGVFHKGMMDEFRIWTKVRTQAEIMATMNCELRGDERDLAVYYNFNQGTAGGSNSTVTTLVSNATNSGTTFNGILENFALTGATSNWVSSANGVSGTCNTAAAPTAMTGNRALAFDGINDFVSTGNLNLSGNYFTFETWVNATQFQTIFPFISSLIGIETSLANAALIRLGDAGLPGNRPQFALAVDGNYQRLNANTVLNAGQWYHIAATYDGTMMRIYVNGNLDNELPILGSATANGPFDIGFTSITPGVRYLNGFLDEVRVWNYARCEADLKATMNCELSGNESGLVRYYNFNQGVAGGVNVGRTTLNNNAASGAAFNGTLNNFSLLSSCTSNWVGSSNSINGNCNFTTKLISNILLTNTNIQENNAINAVIGTLSYFPNCAGVSALSLVPGQLDNAFFNLNINQLRASTSFDFEARNRYNILVRASGSFGTYDKIFHIDITNMIDANEVIVEPEISAKAGSKEVTLTWQNVPSANQYEVFMYANGIAQRLVGTTTNNSFVVSGLENGITYYFRVVALLTNFNIRSGFSNTVSARPSIILGIEEETSNNIFKLYPNPNNGSFGIAISELKGKNAQISVLDLSGRVVYQQTLQVGGSLETELNISLAAGMYVLQVSTEKENLRRKLVIEQ
jgi:hypothetical protein